LTPRAHSMRSPFQLTRGLIPSPSVRLSHLRAGHTLLDDVPGMNFATTRTIACAHHVALRVVAPDIDGRLTVRRAVRLQASLIEGSLSSSQPAFTFCAAVVNQHRRCAGEHIAEHTRAGVSRSYVQLGAPPGHPGPAALPQGRDDGDGMAPKKSRPTGADTTSRKSDGNRDGNGYAQRGPPTHPVATDTWPKPSDHTEQNDTVGP
jgi:hypothetical protein